MAEDLKELMKHIPALMAALERANLIPPAIDIVRKESGSEGEVKGQKDSGTQEEVDLATRIKEIDHPEEVPKMTQNVRGRMAPSERSPAEVSPNGRGSATSSRVPEIADPISVEAE